MTTRIGCDGFRRKNRVDTARARLARRMDRGIVAGILACTCLVGAFPGGGGFVAAQTLEQQLTSEAALSLARAALETGDAQRGGVVFYQPYLACTKCHVADQSHDILGPDLTKLGRDATDVYLIESVLHPSKDIKEGFEPVTVIRTDGRMITGLVETDEPDQLVLRDAAQDFKRITVPVDDIDERLPGKTSIMPAGQVNVLGGRQQFLDLIRYLMEIRDGGPLRAKELEPPPSAYAVRPLPEYEKSIDHAGMIRDLGEENFQRGEKIYRGLCINCHGTHDRPGSLPTSLRFASGQFKNGSDPYAMYQTLTRGFGMMVPQTWMVPQQKYDVIHYIREAYLRTHNPTQYVPADAEYLAGLPQGTERGPEPSHVVPWEQMDYGPNLVATYEIGKDGSNFAYKGNAIRLDHGPGGVSQGQYWTIFDYDTLRVAATWSGKGFIDWNGINFNGQHAIHPRIVGQVHHANPIGPGWGRPGDGSFEEVRVRGRDGRPYGPLPRAWAHYRGMYYHGNDTIISYTVGDSPVLEMPGLVLVDDAPVMTRTFNIGSRSSDMVLQVARHPQGSDCQIVALNSTEIDNRLHREIAVVGKETAEAPAALPRNGPLHFDGRTYVEMVRGRAFDLRDGDFSIVARIRTRSGGTILAKTKTGSEWVPDGKSLFVRDGRLCYDVGWVGVAQSRRKVNDGQWHSVAVVYRSDPGHIALYVDGTLDGRRRLRPRRRVSDHVVRIGFTAEDFPEPSYFEGSISEVRFYQRALDLREVADWPHSNDAPADPLLGQWNLSDIDGDRIRDQSGRGNHGQVRIRSDDGSSLMEGLLIAGWAGRLDGAQWQTTANGDVRLRIPAGAAPLRFTLWLANAANRAEVEPLVGSLILEAPDRDLSSRTRGGPARWPEVLKTRAVVGDEEGPFATDVLTHPVDNPWFCRMRLTGFDFFPDGDRAAVSAWDGNVWLVSGLSRLGSEPAVTRDSSGGADSDTAADGPELTWRRIASGLFQPLGVRIVDNQIYVTCRDEICILHDLNGDGEADFLENFNNDHQVTEHFHEFAMGLQTDDEGNFYYAKSARHALPALVPHHGTLLRVSRDGLRTDIVATGFRAANGVCINPDGTFLVTDQEGHWTPKNRVNWVKEGGFYGNMLGYHDVTDPSDDAMEQPLCWITNAFDRSPSELLWVDSKAWGPLYGSLLNFSYGYGKVYVVPHEEVNGQKQGGMCQLPIPPFPTGVMRGRFHPKDGQLYTCGMFAWAGNQTEPGGFFRIRYTGKPVYVPVGLNAKRKGMAITFSGRLDPQSASDPRNYAVKTWTLKRTANYGSDHYHERSLRVASASLSSGGEKVELELPQIEPTWCMEIKYAIKSIDGASVDGVIHNTVHHLAD